MPSYDDYFAPGHARIAGRKKGTKNKVSTSMREAIAKNWPGYHPVVAMAALANDESQPIELRFSANREVAQYLEPKRKSVEHFRVIEDGPIQRMTLDELNSLRSQLVESIPNFH